MIKLSRAELQKCLIILYCSSLRATQFILDIQCCVKYNYRYSDFYMKLLPTTSQFGFMCINHCLLRAYNLSTLTTTRQMTLSLLNNFSFICWNLDHLQVETRYFKIFMYSIPQSSIAELSSSEKAKAKLFIASCCAVNTVKYRLCK